MLAFLAAALAAVTPHDAAAVTLHTVVSNIHQIGFTGNVSLGHVAIGSTNYNRITVSAQYIASCGNAQMLSTTGNRTLTASALTGGLTQYTSVPPTVPSLVSMPGYQLLAPGSMVVCTYNWQSRAVEASFTAGSGITFPVGGGEMAEGSTTLFDMLVPSATEETRSEDCLP